MTSNQSNSANKTTSKQSIFDCSGHHNIQNFYFGDTNNSSKENHEVSFADKALNLGLTGIVIISIYSSGVFTCNKDNYLTCTINITKLIEIINMNKDLELSRYKQIFK